MHTALPAILIGVWVVAAISMAVMGWRDHRRANALARKAHEMFMKFSIDDPFDIPRRYGPFAVIATGHSVRAGHVTYGRLEGVSVRAFDLRYELGHGTRRSTRFYGVIALESPADLGDVLLWNQREDQAVPVAAQMNEGRLDGWSFRGDRALAERLADCCQAFRVVSAQSRGNTVMFCFSGRDYMARLGDVRAMIQSLGLGSASAASRSPHDQPSDYPSIPGVENHKAIC